MIYFMENPIKIDDLGGFPLFWVDTQIGPIGHSNRIFLGRAPVLQHHPGATKKWATNKTLLLSIILDG